MIYTEAIRTFYIGNGVTCECRIPLPDLSADSEQAHGLGESYSEKKENLDMFLSEIFFPQYTRALKRAIELYKVSNLPEKFLFGHRVIVEPLPVFSDGIHAIYVHEYDLIIIDANTLLIGSSIASGNFIYGHEMGHRIMYLSNPQIVLKALSDVQNIVEVSNKNTQCEILADAFGSLLCNKPSRFTSVFSPLKQDGLRRIALKLAWSV